VLRARGRGLLPPPSPLINNKEAKSDEADLNLTQAASL